MFGTWPDRFDALAAHEVPARQGMKSTMHLEALDGSLGTSVALQHCAIVRASS